LLGIAVVQRQKRKCGIKRLAPPTRVLSLERRLARHRRAGLLARSAAGSCLDFGCYHFLVADLHPRPKPPAAVPDRLSAIPVAEEWGRISVPRGRGVRPIGVWHGLLICRPRAILIIGQRCCWRRQPDRRCPVPSTDASTWTENIRGPGTARNSRDCRSNNHSGDSVSQSHLRTSRSTHAYRPIAAARSRELSNGERGNAEGIPIERDSAFRSKGAQFRQNEPSAVISRRRAWIMTLFIGRPSTVIARPIDAGEEVGDAVQEAIALKRRQSRPVLTKRAMEEPLDDKRPRDTQAMTAKGR